MTTYNWTIAGINSKTSYNGQTNVVNSINYVITGNDGTNETSISSMVNIDYTGGEFIPFENLTEATVISWAQTSVGEARIVELHNIIDEDLARIAAIPAPTETFHSGETLPWANK